MLEKRNPIFAAIVPLVTFGIYMIYWFYQTLSGMVEKTGKDINPGLWTVLLFVPIVNIFMVWKYTNMVEEVVGEHSAVMLFVVWIFLAPVAIYLIQSDLNTVAGR